MVFSQYIKNEVKCGSLTCSLFDSVLPLVKVSSIGLIPQPHHVGKWHLLFVTFQKLQCQCWTFRKLGVYCIHDHIDHAVGCTKNLGICTQLIKVDLTKVHIHVHPCDDHLLGISLGRENMRTQGSVLWFTFSSEGVFGGRRYDGLGAFLEGNIHFCTIYS